MRCTCLAPRGSPCCAPPRWPPVFLPDVDQPLAVAPDRLFQRLRIRRAVVDQHDFEVRMALRENGIPRLPGLRRRLARRNNDADQRFLPLVQDAHPSRDPFSKLGSKTAPIPYSNTLILKEV